MFEVKAKAREVLIYGEIGRDLWAEESIAARDVIDALQEIPGSEPITVSINSYGGSFADGAAIYNALRRHPAEMRVVIDGYAYSMASHIAMAGDTVTMAENAMMMIHAPFAPMATGNAQELRRAAEVLDRHAEALKASYSRNGAVSEKKIDAWLSGEQDYYFTAAEAKAEGLIDSIDAPVAVAASGTLADIRGRQTTGDNRMPDKERSTIEAEASQRERDRISAIDGAFSLSSVSALGQPKITAMRNKAISENWDLSKTHLEILKAMPDDDAITGGGSDVTLGASTANSGFVDIRAGADTIDKARKGMVMALDVRARFDRTKETARAMHENPFAGMSLPEMARHCLVMHGHSVRGMSKMQIVGRALTVRGDQGITHTSSDFPALVENIAEKAVLRGWDEAPETWSMIAREGTLPDFKQASRAAMNAYPTLPQLGEDGEYSYATVGDRKNPIVLVSYGSIIGLSRKLIINDDLNELTRIPAAQGRAASRTIGNIVYFVYTSNGLMGEDGKPIFDEDHNNIATVSGPPTVETLDDARQLMALQTDGDENATGLNLRPAKVIVPIALETNTRVLQQAQNDPNSARDGVPNPFSGQFETVADARLDAVSKTAWYAMADPIRHDTIEIAFLEGAARPRLEQKEGWTVDGVELKVGLDAGAAALDFRTAVYNPGA